jgi:transposase-like protein
MTQPKIPPAVPAVAVPSVERIQQELATATSVDDFFGKEGIFARLFARTLEQMMEAELTAQLGYAPYAASGRNSGNNRNGKRTRTLQTSAGEVPLAVPRDRNGEYQPALLEAYQTRTNELETKILALYAKGLSTRDIQDTLQELYGVEISPATVTTVTDKIWNLVEAWQSRPLASVYPIVYLDAIHLKLRRDGRVQNTAVYVVLGVDCDGGRDVLGHWVGDGGEGANFWLSVVTDIQNRGVEDIFIACIDGLTGFKEAIQAVFPATAIQRCVIHAVRQCLNYISWQDRKAFVADLKKIYQAPTRAAGETALLELGERWGRQYASAVRIWERNWEDLATMFDYPAEIRRLIYTTNTVEGYNRQLRKVLKTKGALPTNEAARKLLYLVTADITRTWITPIFNWTKIRNQLAIRFEGRFLG